MGRRGRRGVSEVYSALLVLVIAVGTAAAVYAAAGVAARGVEEAGVWVARLASDSAAPVVIVPEVRGRGLWVSYESLGSPVSQVIVVDPSSGAVLSRVEASGHRGEVLALESYDCRPVAVAAVLESGAVKVYDARLDPRAGGQAGSPYYTCSLNQSPEAPSGGQQAAAEETLLDLGTALLRVSEAAPGPEQPRIAYRELPEPVAFTASISMAARDGACLGSGVVEASVNGSPAEVEPYRVSHPYGWQAEGYRVLIGSVEGTSFYLAVLCYDYVALTAALVADSPFAADVEVSLYIERAVVKDSYAPGLYLVTRGEASYNTLVTVRWLASPSSPIVEAGMAGSVESLNGAVVLSVVPLASNVDTAITLDVEVSVAAIGSLEPGSPAVVQLPQPPLEVTVIPYKYSSQRYASLIEAPGVLALLEPAPTYYLRVSGGQGWAETPMQPGQKVRVASSEFRASIVVELGEQCRAVDSLPQEPTILEENRGSVVRIHYGPSRTPTPIGECKPHLVFYSGPGSSRGLVAVEPFNGAPNLYYLGRGWEALAAAVQGVGLEGDTVIGVAYRASLTLSSNILVTVYLDDALVNTAPSQLPQGFNLALLQGGAVLVYLG